MTRLTAAAAVAVTAAATAAPTGAQVDAASPDNAIRPMEAAVHGENVQIMQLLIKAGADVNAQAAVNHDSTFQGLNQVAYAALVLEEDAVPVMQVLLSAGACSSSVVECGHDALQIAVLGHNLHMVKNILACDSFPPNADQVAADGGNSVVTES